MKIRGTKVIKSRVKGLSKKGLEAEVRSRLKREGLEMRRVSKKEGSKTRKIATNSEVTPAVKRNRIRSIEYMIF